MRIVVIIPTFNEAENIERLLNNLLSHIEKQKNHSFKILVVDDNSPDGTGEIVEGMMKKYSVIKKLGGEKKGLGKAMIKGYLYAINELRAEIVISNEADFAFDFKHMREMIKKIEQDDYDVVVASRHIGIGKTEGWTLTRRLNHWIANTLLGRWIAGVREVYDKNGAFRAIRVEEIMDQINWRKQNVRGFAFFFYTIALYAELTDKFYEIPAIYKFRRRGESKVSFNPKYIKTYVRDVIEYVKLAFRVRLKKCNINL